MYKRKSTTIVILGHKYGPASYDHLAWRMMQVPFSATGPASYDHLAWRMMQVPFSYTIIKNQVLEPIFFIANINDKLDNETEQATLRRDTMKSDYCVD